MNPLTHLKQIILPLFVSVVFACFGLLPQVQAVCADGCNSGLFNVWQGDDALISDTTGAGNSAFGWRSLFFDTDGSFNTAVGGGALIFNNGSSNTAVGAAALLLNATGSENTAVGTDTLVNNAVDGNTATGAFALFANTIGGTLETSFLGFALGPNTAIGNNALENNVDGSGNTAVGYNALHSQVTGLVIASDPHLAANTAVGFEALANVTGSGSGGDNGLNTALGHHALFDLTDGSSNVAVGEEAGFGLTSGDRNIFIGAFLGPAGSTESGHTYIGNIDNTFQPFGGTVGNVTIDTAGGVFPHRLGIDTSPRRYKEDIKPMDKLSETVFKLKPVSYRIKKEINPAQPSAFGLIAEDVEEANPDLVLHNAKGQPEGVHYQMVNVMLLNEFLKEHRTVQELKSSAAKQEATIAKQQKQIEALTAGLQKVSAQLELSKPAPQTVLNNR